jgi:hypothetical protein
MKDSLLIPIAWVVVIAMIFTISWSLAWTKFSLDVSVDCEKSRSFSINNKVYKCEPAR